METHENNDDNQAGRLEFHEIANLFPLIEGEEFDRLVLDIRDYGLYRPIVLYEDKILDGRNRYLACLEAEVEPRYEQYSGDDPVAFVVSHNLRRREMSASQRGLIAAELANLAHGTNRFKVKNIEVPKGTSITIMGAAKQLDVGRTTVMRAKTILEDGDASLIEKVRKGEVNLTEATKQIEEMQKEVEAIQKAVVTNFRKIQDEFKKLADLHKKYGKTRVPITATFTNAVQVGMDVMGATYERLFGMPWKSGQDPIAQILQLPREKD
jgi:hypothetical protein